MGLASGDGCHLGGWGAVLNHDIQSLDDIRKWGLVAENIAASEPTTSTNMAAAFRRLEDSLNEKFEKIQLRALGDGLQATRRQTSPPPTDRFHPERHRDHTPARDWTRENRRYYAPPSPPLPERYQQRERQRYPSPPPARYQQRREEPRHNPPPHPPPHRYEQHPPPHGYQQPARHPARRDEQQYMGPASRRGRQIQGAQNLLDFESCDRCGLNHGEGVCNAINAECRRCKSVGHYSRKCVARGPQGSPF